MSLKVTILGCGNSAGTPTIGNYWGNCDPNEPKNKRTRPSLSVQSETTTIIVDTGPDFREQFNTLHAETVHAVLYTHPHGDHIHGIDELRVFRYRFGEYVHIYGNRPTIDELEERFTYLFRERNSIYPKVIEPHIFDEDTFCQTQTIGDISFIPFEQDHGTCQTVGYRFYDMAYSTDLVDLNQQALEQLIGIDTWIIDAAGYKMEKNPVHANFKKVYELNEIVQANRVILTHLSPQMDYETMVKELPSGYEPAYDGLMFDIDYK
jgi:phosphoribosyl 1,2-cyclic phosphate phosphodiesterase